MSRFNERLALLADSARALPNGDELARGLMRLAADIDGYLDQQITTRHTRLNAAFSAWSDFMNGSLQHAYDESDQRIVLERRKVARMIAGDPRWTGGYADALNLIERGHDDQ